MRQYAQNIFSKFPGNICYNMLLIKFLRFLENLLILQTYWRHNVMGQALKHLWKIYFKIIELWTFERIYCPAKSKMEKLHFDWSKFSNRENMGDQWHSPYLPVSLCHCPLSINPEKIKENPSENQRFFDVLRGYSKISVARNGLKRIAILCHLPGRKNDLIKVK